MKKEERKTKGKQKKKYIVKSKLREGDFGLQGTKDLFVYQLNIKLHEKEKFIKNIVGVIRQR